MNESGRNVFISYSWGAEKRHPLVGELLAALKAKDIEVKRDSNAINYGDSIKAYMDKLAAGGAIILVLSEEYFKSPNCMYELREIYLNNRKEFRQRIFPVVLHGTKFHRLIDRIPYIRHWEEETKKLNDALGTVARENIGTVSHNELRDYADFRRIIDELLALIGDMNHLTEEEHLKTGFAALIERMFSRPEPDGGGGTDKTGQKESQSKPGTLFHVPDPPPNYLERDDDLKKFRDALLAKGTQAVGIIGKRQHVGVLGMGGLGKSVLAAALARDQAVRAAFPDGIFWLTFGQHPDEARLLELQAGILRQLAPGQQPESLDHGADLLSLALEDRRCLLIADDLWASCHLRYFRLGGSSSRLLLTTRNAEVIKKAGALPCQIGLLSDPQARKLLAECSGYDENALPDEAAAIVQECGHLPLAIAAVGSMVWDEKAGYWQVVLKRLQTARLDKIPANVTIDYEHENLFKVFQVSVEALPPEVQAYYKTLLVFPEDARIPQSVLQLYWKHNCLGDYEPLEIISILVKRSLLSRIDDDFFALHDLLRDYLTYQSGGDVASLHKQLLEAYRAEYAGEWHTIPVEPPYYFYKYWHVHLQAAGEMAQASIIANALIKKQPWTNLIGLRIALKFVDYQFSDVAANLLKENNHPQVLIACLKLFGIEAKEDAKRLLKVHDDPLLIAACLNILGSEAKEDAWRFLKESNQPHILIACLKILDAEAKEDAKRLLKEHDNPLLIIACLSILGDEAKEDAKRLLKEEQHLHVLVACLNILGNEAKEDARRLLKEIDDKGVLCKCLKMLNYEAKEDARRLLKEEQHPHILAACLKILGYEAKEDAKRLLKIHDNPPLISACFRALGTDKKEQAWQLLKESKHPHVQKTCLKILGEEAKEDAKRLLRESTYSHVLTACLKILGDEAKEDARRLLKSSKNEGLLFTCIRILGKEAKADAMRLAKTGRTKLTRDICKELLFSWEDTLGSKSPELACLKKNDSSDETS